MKNLYTIQESQDHRSYREGYNFKGTLTGAKISASKRRFFEGTCLKITNECGDIVAFKEPGKKWENRPI